MEVRGEASDVSAGGDKGVEDMIKMNNLSEEGILRNLKIRYQRNLIYTNTGSILVSLNPYQRLPIYTQEAVREYIGTTTASIGPPPHIFAIAEACYHDMRDRSRNQSVIISGESGAGKTEATKLILQFLAARTTKHSSVEQKILESSPILEAFGNAKTVRNDNSSRFGKFIEIHFEGSGQICGARISNYLLERSRLVYQAESERNYHIFYQFLAGADKKEKERYQLLNIDQYHYLNQSGCTSVPTINDSADYDRVRNALSAMDMSEATQDSIFIVLSGIMRLGNILFEGSEVAKISNPEELEVVGRLLKISPEGLGKALTTRTLVVSGQSIQVNFKPLQAADARDALAKAIYSRLFDWLVTTINKVIHKAKNVKSFIGVLDIFGFENFKVNSFEQFCINYANEKLQQFFNETIFKIEQAEYAAEAIKWDNIEFNDNQDTIDLIEKARPPGLISLLDEECRFPKATDATFLEKIEANYKSHKKFERAKKSRTAFVIRHYAGEVIYETTNFLDKNRDTLADDLITLLNGSGLPLIKDLFANAVSDTQASGGRGQAKPPTVGTNFKLQLAELMSTLGATAPHYVRCIKPNTMKAANMFDDDMVLAQLRYAGMMETIRIRRLGYPVRYPMKEFMYRYRMLLPASYMNDKKNKDKSGQIDVLAAIKTILSKISSASSSSEGGTQWQIGKTKVFLKETHNAALENARNAAIWTKVVTIQAWWRMAWTRSYFLEMRQATILAQATVRGFLQRRRYRKIRDAERKRKEEERRKREEERRKQEEARRKKQQQEEAERKKQAAASNAKGKEQVSAQTEPEDIVRSRKGTILCDEAPVVSMYKTSSPLERYTPDDDDDAEDDKPESSWNIPTSTSRKDPRAGHTSLRKRLTLKRDQTMKKHKPMLGKGQGDEEIIPDIISKEEIEKYDIEEYANAHFNFERSKKKGAFRTLRRKKEDFSLSQVLWYSKKLEQPLHSTQNDNFAKYSLKFFKKITKFIDGEANMDSLKEVFLAGISNGGSLRIFRNELYCQLIKQTMHNPSKDSALRAWELLSAFCGAFYPTEEFASYLAAYLMAHFEEKSDIGKFAQYAYDKLKMIAFHFSHKISRLYPPSNNELQANKECRPLKVWFQLPGGTSTCLLAEAGMTAADAFIPLTSKNLRLKDPIEFAIFEVYPHLNLGRSLSPSDFLADMLSKAEKYGYESLFWFKKKLWLDPTVVPDDIVEARLEMLQLHGDIISGNTPCKVEDVIALSAIKVLIDEFQDSEATKTANFVEKYVPPVLLGQKRPSDWTQLIKEESEKLRGNGLGENGLVKFFLKRAQQLPLYGKTLFQVQLATTDIDFPDTFTLAIDVHGIEVRDKSSAECIRKFSYQELGAITFDATSCIINFNEKLKRRPMHLKTPLGVEISSLCEDYLFWLREDSSTAIAIQDYVVSDPKLLSFTKGQRIELISREGNWWRGKVNGKAGAFPSSMVEVQLGTKSSEASSSSGSSSHLRHRLSQRLSTRSSVEGVPTKSPQGSMIGSRRGSKSGVATPVEMKGVSRRSSRVYYSKLAGSSDVQNRINSQSPVASPTGSPSLTRHSTRLSRRYDIMEFAQSHFTTLDPATHVPKARGITTLRRGMMGARAGKQPEATAASSSASTKASSVSIAFSDAPIKEPLTKTVPEELFKKAVKMFVSVMKYMGDYPSKKGVNQFDLMQKVCQTAIDHPKLRDELFCQLIKQTTDNPRKGATVRGWELLAICCGLFVPSRNLGPYLVDYILQRTKSVEGEEATTKEQDVRKLATAAIQRLDRIRAVGLRLHAPSLTEFDAVRGAERVPCMIWTQDGLSHVVYVDMAATVKDVTRLLIDELGLSDEAIKLRDWKLCGIRGSIDEAKHRFGIETGEPLGDGEHVCDAMALWEKEIKVKGPMQFVLLEWLSLDHTGDIADPVAIHLLAHQAVSRVVSGRHPVTEGEAAYLAALQYYFDKIKGKVEGSVTEKTLYMALFYLPINLKPKKTEEEWLSAILNEWNQLDLSMSIAEAEKKYLETAKRWKFFGGNVFFIESKQFPLANAISVNKEGLAVLRLPEKEPLAFAAFRAIFNWSANRNESVGVVVGSLMNPQRYVFVTSQAKQVVQTFATLVEKLVAEKKLQKETKAQAFAQATVRRDMRVRRPF